MNSAQKQEPIAPNRVPMGAVRLSAAFVLVYRALTPDWEDISYQCEQCDELEARGEETPTDYPHRMEFEATKRAEVAFRNALSNNEISAYICDVATGIIVELNPKDWWKLAESSGIWNDYTSPTDPKTPGPDCISEGVRQPVFLMREQLLTWLKKIGTEPVLDLRNPDIKEIFETVSTGPILRWVVAYFLEHHIDGLPNNKQSKRTDAAIAELLVKIKLRDREDGADRSTNRKAYDLAMRIARLTKSPENWRVLGVPKLPTIHG